MEQTLEKVLQLAKEGDGQARDRIVRIFESRVKKYVRRCLIRFRVNIVADEADVCQTVFLRFFQRLRDGQYHPVSLQKLAGFLSTIGRNILIDEIRHGQVKQSAQVRLTTNPPRGDTPGLDTRVPDDELERKELLERIYALLTCEEKELVDRHFHGESWAAIATDLGLTPDATRKRLKRALTRVSFAMKRERLAQ